MLSFSMTSGILEWLICTILVLIPIAAFVYLALLRRVRRNYPELLRRNGLPSSARERCSLRYRGALGEFFHAGAYRVIDDRTIRWLAQILLGIGRIYWLLWLILFIDVALFNLWL
jgi:hypothetical protein